MFEGCLELCLTFIGVQPVHRGCSSAELSEFICEDVLPYQGWAANATLRSTIVRLLLTTKASEFTLYTLPAITTRSAAGQRAASSGSRGGRGGGGGRAKKAAPVVGTSDPFEAAVTHTPLTAEAAVVQLDAGRVAWSTSKGQSCDVGAEGATQGGASLPSTPPSKDEPGILFYLVPSRELRERVLGFAIRNEKQEMVSQFIAENAMQGWERLPNSADFKARYKSHLLGGGLKWLRRVHKITLLYLYRKTTHEVLYRFFPHFALPLTEREKAEQPQWMTEAGATSTQALCRSAAPATATSAEPHDEVYHHPTSVVQSRLCRRCNPLDHYFARKRRDDVSFPRVVFDLQLVRQLVQQSPERRLLMQDAVHAILTAHDLHDTRWEDFSKTERMHLRRLLDCAGLRIVVAVLSLRGHDRELRLVIPAEDVVSDVGAVPLGGSSSSAGQKRQRSDSDNDTEQKGGPHSGDDSDVGDLADSFEHDGLVMRTDRGVRRATLSGGVENEDDGSDSDGENEEAVKEEQQLPPPPPSPSAMVRPTTRHRLAEAAAVLRVDPGQTVELQAAHEAERRPLALTSLFPRMRFQMPDKLRRKILGGFMEKYVKLRGTLETQYLLMKYSKSFMLVYAPRVPTPAAAMTAVKTEDPFAAEDAKRAPHSSPQQRLGVATDGPAATTATPPALVFHFEHNDPRLPKGVTAYSVNTVLEVLLQAAPHHAASLPRLTKAIDITTLQRRVLPLLRQLEYVYTTGFSQRGKKRVGMVVLRAPQDDTGAAGDEVHVLDDAAKRAVLDAEAALSSGALSAARPPPPLRGKAIPSALVLDAVPAMSDGVAHSTTAEGLLRAHPNAAKAVSRVMAMRNGYARSALQRVSRLHLELWAQHCLYSSDAAFETGVRVCEMFDRMALSTYCIVVGLPQGDVAGVLDLGGVGADAQDEEGSGNKNSGFSSSYAWSTPIKSLPPSLYGWCVQQGLQMLCMCLTELQDRQLVRSTDQFQHLLLPDLRDEVCYALCPSVSVESCTYSFATAPPSASSSLYACMRYWLPVWNTVRCPQQGLEAELLSAEPNPSVPQVVALCKVMRREPGVMAAQLYQNCGVPRGLRNTHRLGEMHSAERGTVVGRDNRRRITFATYASPSSSLSSMRLRGQQGNRRRSNDAAEFAATSLKRQLTVTTAHHGPSLHKAARTEVSGATVADALECAFHHFAPLKRVEEVVRLVLRGRGQHLSQHPLFSVPPVLPAVLRPGADLTHALAGFSWAGNVYRTEFNVSNTGQGGASYNRTLSLSTLHMGGLGETLRVIRQGQAAGRPPHRPPGGNFSSTESLREEVESVYAPRAALPSTTTASPLLHAQSAAAAEARTDNSVSFPSASPALEASSAETAQQHARLAAEFEVVTDILRMVLFSDQAHYRASIARALLSDLNAQALVTRARLLLQKMPVFCRSRRHNFRVPLLSLVYSPYVLPPSALRGGPRPCANISILHHWTHALDDMGTACSSGVERLRMVGKHTALQALLRVDAGQALNSNTFSCVDVTVFPAPLQLVHQPTMELARLSMAPNAVRDYMTKLPLPRLTWPQTAVECERRGQPARDRTDADEGEEGDEEGNNSGNTASGEAGVAVPTVGRRRTRRRRHHKRVRTSSSSAAATVAEGTRSDASESDSEDERAVLRGEAEATRQLYPARSVRNLGDPAYLRDLPIDGPPTPSEQRAVERCREALAAGRCAALSTDVAFSPYHVPYPSIFHHVDGSFHQYMWQLVVHAVYRFVLRVPGITHADLESRLMASGVLSQRAVRAVLRFLLDRQLLACKEEELSQDRWVAGGGVLGAAPRVRGPFHGSTAAPRDSKEGAARTVATDAAASFPPLPLTPSSEVDAMKFQEGGFNRRCCYTAIVPLEALQFSLSAATW
ncbi:hypothetical protein ABB37_07835 [Leptomonas pyrrhocoris]|uniref:Uncharacterized protein n=1 Tax=Leptomonas pyrrhocoris TaxID=157538 RepID=A0A0M9FUY9_LEPPY|nr:hypothetical protein ABB37_07835 [Leptomonas pyrrhocoris]KPA76543.1 hypothetical protein ABB37_07835 [Leptomonas pyrrhocoris]|eukprot:XP_015654982.1 hypothetical protein ABB37_07835 [Leptomonas pyrrhocoris]